MQGDRRVGALVGHAVHVVRAERVGHAVPVDVANAPHEAVHRGALDERALQHDERPSAAAVVVPGGALARQPDEQPRLGAVWSGWVGQQPDAQ